MKLGKKHAELEWSVPTMPKYKKDDGPLEFI